MTLRFHDEDILSNLDVEESKAFVDLLILTVLIDGEITEEELDGLADQWSQLPFAGDDHLEDLVGEHGYETRAFLQDNIQDTDKIDAFISKMCARITREPTQEAAVRMIAVVSSSDGLAEAETKLAHQIGGLFGFSDERTDALLAQILDA